MSDETVTLYDENGNAVQVPKPESPNARQMRERIEALEVEARRAKELEAELGQMKRGVALRDAGLELDAARQKALEAVHEGEWTPEAVRQTATQLGWASPTPDVPPEEVDAFGRMQAAFTGASTPTPNADADFDARLASATSEREFRELYERSGRPMV